MGTADRTGESEGVADLYRPASNRVTNGQSSRICLFPYFDDAGNPIDAKVTYP
jgi:hypothetical protein